MTSTIDRVEPFQTTPSNETEKPLNVSKKVIPFNIIFYYTFQSTYRSKQENLKATKKFLSKLKELKTELFTTTTAHGFGQIERNKHLIVKLFWILLTAVFAVFVYFVIRESVIDFFSYTTISSSEKKQNDSLTFPAISLCWSLEIRSGITLYQSSKFKQLSFANMTVNYENFTTQRHSCYKINGDKDSNGELLISQEEGRLFGMNLIVNSSAPELYIYIGNNSYRPVSPEVENTILRRNHVISIAIIRVESELLPKPIGNCQELIRPDDFNSSEYASIYNSSSAYRQLNCLEMYAVSKVKKECGCESVTACDRLCMLRKKNEFNMRDSFSTYCPLECKSVKFTPSINSFYSPTDSNFNINIYYEEMIYYDEVQLPKMTFSSNF